MAIVGYALVILGMISMLLGMVIGAKDAFKRNDEAAANFAISEKLLDVLLALLDATPAKFFTGIGFLLVLVGLGVLGFEISDAKDGAAAASALTSMLR